MRFAIGWMILLAACTQTVADDALSVCQPLCSCTDIPLPGEQHECVAGCVKQFEVHPLGDACVACVIDHASRCTGLLEDCQPICTQATPLRSYAQPSP